MQKLIKVKVVFKVYFDVAYTASFVVFVDDYSYAAKWFVIQQIAWEFRFSCNDCERHD